MATKKKPFVKKETVVRIPFRPSYPPSEEQKPILQDSKFGDESIHIDATAGSGKSTVLKWAMTMEPHDRACCLSMGREIANEIEPHCPPHVDVNTVHGFGRRAIVEHIRRQPFLNNAKVRTIFKDLFPSKNPELKTGKDKSAAYSFLYDVSKLVDLLRINLRDENSRDEIERTINQYNIAIENVDEVAMMLPLIYQKMLENVSMIDFTDMMWLPIRLNLKVPQYPMMYVDERQDLNSLMIEYIFRMSTDRIMTVGDEFQCQPSGTMVMLDNGGSVPIESLKVGDTVVSYHPSQGYVMPNDRITEVQSRPYFGDLIDVKAEDKTASCTPNHKWFVKWNSDAVNKYAVYLMLKDGKFRIGMAKLFYEFGHAMQNGPATRMQAESADALWIIKVTDTQGEAAVYENLYSYKFGIPQMVFVDNNCKDPEKQSLIDQFWRLFDCNYDKGAALLDYLDMDIQYPFKTKGDVFHAGLSNSFFVFACNLIEDIMMVPVFNTYKPIKKSVNNQWRKIKLSKRHYSGLVYSLNVEKAHTYVSNGLLTGNSIMGFAGADLNSTKRLLARFAGNEYPLNTCYRCGKLIIELAKTICPRILAFDGAIDGEVVEAEQIDLEMPDGSMVLSRRNANLVKPCFAMLRAGRKAIIKGKDIGEALISLIEGLKASDPIDLIDKVETYRDKRIEKISAKEDCSQSQIDKTNDECQCVIEIASSCKSIEEIIDRIRMIFDNSVKGVTFSSIHRSKGLEADEVTIIDYNRIRLNNEKMSEEDHIQERNLHFVAVTRAKKKLTLIH